ncbi:CerR family C-terminal domain-containing protein [Sphingomonas panacisoli]|uniref:CerR family C-terminal domain-containing protein n=1 Tax=Sphingomonas panacisoli TaxID=1813879 RepID=UPI001F0303E7|nr:CerR family C-terminal domain-containing protein [Sphingomonas panacisoli]
MVQQRLLDIAIEQFGQHGLEGVSTREIAAAANTAMSSITYHYGGKEGLYLAAADEVAKQMGGGHEVSAFEQVAASGDPVAARGAIADIMRVFLKRLQQPQSNSWALFIMREQLNPTEAFERIYAGPMGQTGQVLVELICVATGGQDRQAARLAAISLFGQVLVMKAARAMCRKMLERETLSEEIIDEYAARVVANIDAILDRMIAERQEQI